MGTSLSAQLTKQLALLLSAVAATAIWFLVWGPRHGLVSWAEHRPWRLVLLCLVIYAAANAALLARTYFKAHGAPASPLARVTFWLGLVSAASLLTSFLLGWLALLLAPAGIATGLVVLVRELHTGQGHNGANLLGLLLSLGAILFLLA